MGWRLSKERGGSSNEQPTQDESGLVRTDEKNAGQRDLEIVARQLLLIDLIIDEELDSNFAVGGMEEFMAAQEKKFKGVEAAVAMAITMAFMLLAVPAAGMVIGNGVLARVGLDTYGFVDWIVFTGLFYWLRLVFRIGRIKAGANV